MRAAASSIASGSPSRRAENLPDVSPPPGLAGAPGAGEGEQAKLPVEEQCFQLLQLALSADERRRRRREVGRDPLGRSECRLLLQNLALQLLQLRARLQPEFLAQPVARLPVELQRFLLPAAAIEGEHR